MFASARWAAAASSGRYRTEVLADGPYCYYPLDDAVTPTDVMGRTVPASVKGVTLGAPGIGDGATAGAFDAGQTGRGIDIPSDQFPPGGTLTGMTIEIIAQMSNTAAQRAMFGNEGVFLLRHSATGLIDPFTGVNGWSNRIEAAGYAEPEPTKIHHWAIVWDGANAMLYRDGSVVLSEAQVGTIGNPASLRIGSRQTADATFFGSLAGFAFYDKPLSQERIIEHAKAALDIGSLVYRGTMSDVSDSEIYTFTDVPIGIDSATRRVVIGFIWGGADAPDLLGVTIGGVAADIDVDSGENSSSRKAVFASAIIPAGQTTTVVITAQPGVTRCAIGIWTVENSTLVYTDSDFVTSAPTFRVPAEVGDHILAIGIATASSGSQSITWAEPMFERFDVQLEGTLNAFSGADHVATTAGDVLVDTGTTLGTNSRAWAVASYRPSP